MNKNGQKFVKDFRKWSEVAERIERRKLSEFVKVGAIYWCSVGVGVGSELTGKGESFSRPVLVLAALSDRMFLILPITSQSRAGRNYVPVMVNGWREYAALNHVRAIDGLRLENFMDEVDAKTVGIMKKELIKFLKRYLYPVKS